MANLIRKFCFQLVVLALAGAIVLPPSSAAQSLKACPLDEAVRVDPLFKHCLEILGTDKAIEPLQKLSDKYPQCPTAVILLADNLALQRMFEKSLQQFQKLDVDSFPLKTQHHIRCGMSACEVRLGKIKEADAEIKKIVSVPPFPDSADSYIFVAWELADSDKNRKALDILDWAMSVKMPDKQLRSLLKTRAKVHLKFDQRAEALRDWRAFEKLIPDNDINAFIELAAAYFEGNFPTEGVSLIRLNALHFT